MPRYFFETDDGVHIHGDEGTTLPDPSNVEMIALHALGEMAQNKTMDAKTDPLTVTVGNEAGEPVFRAMLTLQTGWLAKLDG